MSEYTKYFAVKSSSGQDVKNKLNAAKIISIVDVDNNDYGFSEKYKRNGLYNWVVVCAPANHGFDNNNIFFHLDQFDNLAKIFSDFVYFFQEENMIDWYIKIKSETKIIEKYFYSEKAIFFDENEKDIFSKCFDKEFNLLEQFLKPGKSDDFLNFVGISYMEMNDQDKIPIRSRNGNYSIFAEELND